MKLTNIEMSNHLNSLNQISGKVKGKLGYAVARNIRKISNELIEFENIRLEHIHKYGTKNDNGDCFIKKDTEEYNKFLTDMQEYAVIAHDVDIYMINAEEIFKSDLTADEITTIDFMINEE